MPLAIVMPTACLFNVNILQEFRRSDYHGRPFSVEAFGPSEREVLARSGTGKIWRAFRNRKNVVLIDRPRLFVRGDVMPSGVPYSLDGAHLSILGSTESEKFFLATLAHDALLAPITATGAHYVTRWAEHYDYRDLRARPSKGLRRQTDGGASLPERKIVVLPVTWLAYRALLDNLCR